MVTLPEKFVERMRERLGDFPAFLASYEKPPYRGLRVNTLKISAEEFLSRAPFPLGDRVPGENAGFYLEEEKPGADVYHFAGLYYLQEPSAMKVGEFTSACKKERVLDLCAAPGGKTTQLAAQMGGRGILISNEIDSGRARILSGNVERMGITNCAVTNASPSTLAALFPSYFDLIVADAPCSGEGMFKKEPNAIPEWSPQNVELCASRQKSILDDAASMLSPDGSLVYSTCTFAEEEDEWQVADFLERHPEFVLVKKEKFYPHRFRGEGHFSALLHKERGAKSRADSFPIQRNGAAERAFSDFAADFFGGAWDFGGRLHTLGDGRMYLVPAGMPNLTGVRLLRLGVGLGDWDGKRFRPAHALAMSLGKYARRKLCLTRKESEKYLHGETLNAGLPDGWCVVCVEEFPLGLGKCVNGVVKNHLPKGLRKIT